VDVVADTHHLKAYSVNRNSAYLVICESGLGNGHESWNPSQTPEELKELSTALNADVVLYDRAGYGKSDSATNARDISRLSHELEAVINKFAHGRKVVLVGHSLGGMIIRDYAIKNPNQVAALLFVDSMHEHYNNPALEDFIYQTMLNEYGATFGGTLEARELAEDIAYGATLSHLPDVPVVALTSMKQDQNNDQSDLLNQATRQQWYEAHEQLGIGITDFTHVATVQSGHYIQLEEPELVVSNIQLLLSKLH